MRSERPGIHDDSSGWWDEWWRWLRAVPRWPSSSLSRQGRFGLFAVIGLGLWLALTIYARGALPGLAAEVTASPQPSPTSGQPSPLVAAVPTIAVAPPTSTHAATATQAPTATAQPSSTVTGEARRNPNPLAARAISAYPYDEADPPTATATTAASGQAVTSPPTPTGAPPTPTATPQATFTATPVGTATPSPTATRIQVASATLSFHPASPAIGDVVDIWVESSAPYKLVNVEGAFDPKYVDVWQTPNGYTWRWQIRPTQVGSFLYMFTAEEGAYLPVYRYLQVYREAPTATPTVTPTPDGSATATSTATPTATPTSTVTATATPTSTASPTATVAPAAATPTSSPPTATPAATAATSAPTSVATPQGEEDAAPATVTPEGETSADANP